MKILIYSIMAQTLLYSLTSALRVGLQTYWRLMKDTHMNSIKTCIITASLMVMSSQVLAQTQPPSTVPEPSSLMLMSAGLVVAAIFRFKKRK
jgi:hypothetical protein